MSDAVSAPFPDREGDLIRALRALTVLVKQEFPGGYSIAEIALEWGADAGLSLDEIQSVRRVSHLMTD